MKRPAGISPESKPAEKAPVVPLRDSSVVTLAQQGHLDAGQIAAAWRFHRAWKRAKTHRVMIEHPTERVDTNLGEYSQTDKLLAAKVDLKIARRVLGNHGFELVAKVCGDGFHVRDMYKDRRKRDMATDLLKIHLKELADIWPV